MISGLYHLTL